MANLHYSGADEIRAAYAELLRTEIDHRQVSGLTADPVVTQNPTRLTPEPYIYIYSVGQNETDVTKDDTPNEYELGIEIKLRYNSYRGGQRQGDEILDQVLRIIREKTNFPDVSQYGYEIYRTTTGDIVNSTDRDRGANYYSITVPFFVSAYWIGLPGARLPQQQASYAYSGFEFAPTGRDIEMWDSGTIEGASSYSNNNNGWDFSAVEYALEPNSEGVLTNRTLTVDSNDDPLGLIATIQYRMDTSVTSVTDTDTWSRVRSLRYGAVTPVTERVRPTFSDDTADTYGLRNLEDWNTASRFVDFGVTNPHNESVTITLQRNQFAYIVIDAAHTLVAVTDDVFGTNVVSEFTRVEIGGYATYVANRPAVVNGETYNYTLTTS